MNFKRIIPAYAVHLFTASGVLLSFFSLFSIIHGHYLEAFIYNGIAVVVDSFDGVLARRADVKKYASAIDGALMDNIIDFITYTLVPAFFFMFVPLLQDSTKAFTLSALLLSSILQFSNLHAKTKDHFFLGFPSYWNLVALYLWLWNLSPVLNTSIIWILVILSFVPIKFIYPSRLDFFSKKVWARNTFYAATVLWGVVTALMLFMYPNIPVLLHIYVIAYIAAYTILSLQKTLTK